jgi:c-di-GMP-binding flagellar brake protein YcgR
MIKTRQYLRVPIPTAVRIKVADRDKEHRFSTLEDVSWGGAFVIMDPPPPEGTRILVQFALKDEKVSLEIWSTVKRVRPKANGFLPGVGVEFDSLDDDARSLIQQLINEEILGLVKAARGD